MPAFSVREYCTAFVLFLFCPYPRLLCTLQVCGNDSGRKLFNLKDTTGKKKEMDKEQCP